jgi:glutamyl-tRNA synthetase
MKKIRTRFAPSPTGPLHIGGVRTALYCYLFAKKNNGDFILRIEDTDQGRYVKGAEDYILEALAWSGISPNEGQGVGGDFGPYRQSERKHLYKKYADELITKGDAYYAFDTSEELTNWREENANVKYDSTTRETLNNSLTLSKEAVQAKIDSGADYVIRYKMPKDETISFSDEIRGNVSFQTNELDDKVLFKSDGMPTYHLANIVDDHLMEITHVIRGEEWLPSTPLHVKLYESFAWEMPIFAHLPLILNPNGKGKLSKRNGDKFGFPVFPIDWANDDKGEEFMGFREQGFLADGFINMLAFLGWNPGTEQEIFSLEELAEAFSLEKVNKSGASFNFDRAKWFNQQYIKTKTGEELVVLTKDLFTEAAYKAEDTYLSVVCDLIKERVTFLKEFPEMGYYFFEDIKEYDEKMLKKKWKPEHKEKIDILVEKLAELADFSGENIENLVKAFMEEFELGFGQVLPVLRISVTGSMQGPAIFDVMALVGKETTIERLKKGIALAVELKG